MALLLIVLVAAAGGAAVAVQAQMIGLIDERLGTLEAVFATYALGGLIAALLMVVARGGALGAWRSVPTCAWSAGVFGLVIIGAISWSVSRLGVVRGLLLVTVFQFLVSAGIDRFGLLGAQVQPLTAARIAGMVLVVAGGWLVLR